ncbi:N-acetyltransferase [Pseudomonas sp. MAFF 212408]|uniref:N-acetyltransferase n=1 Tax=Pseudomonas kitaguniensis TaxID=2607908 RepID=A0A5N7KGV7_9PSED|nr:N-acetyltransferase [Pseudomonas kitaguniensis]
MRHTRPQPRRRNVNRQFPTHGISTQRACLKINGAWADHVLTSLINRANHP